MSNAKDVKRYLRITTIARDELLVTLRNEPFLSAQECIVVPRQVVDGLLTALHIKPDHPTEHQLRLVAQRYFYSLEWKKQSEP